LRAGSRLISTPFRRSIMRSRSAEMSLGAADTSDNPPFGQSLAPVTTALGSKQVKSSASTANSIVCSAFSSMWLLESGERSRAGTSLAPVTTAPGSKQPKSPILLNPAVRPAPRQVLRLSPSSNYGGDHPLGDNHFSHDELRLSDTARFRAASTAGFRINNSKSIAWPAFPAGVYWRLSAPRRHLLWELRLIAHRREI
jgi:hypothetical protein